MARRYGESDDVVHAIEAHHNEVEPRTVEAVLTQAADAISGARPGARRESRRRRVPSASISSISRCRSAPEPSHQTTRSGRVRDAENILWSFAPHDFAVLIHLLDASPIEILAVGSSHLKEGRADVTLTHLKFPGGERAHVFVSWLHPTREHRLVVTGDRRMARSLSSLLGRYGHEVALASRLRSYDRDGDSHRQLRIRTLAARLADRMARRLRRDGAPDPIRVFARRGDAERTVAAYGGELLAGNEEPFAPWTDRP